MELHDSPALPCIDARGRRPRITGPPTISTALARLRGYRNALLESGDTIDNNLVVTIDRIDTAQGRRAAAQLLDNTDATASVCTMGRP